MKHSDPEILEALDLAWDGELGPLGKLRNGTFDPVLADNYIKLLERIEITEDEALHPDFVRLTWFAPIFSEWQIDRAAELGENRQEVTDFSDKIRERMMEILGIP
ncbi:hypothetical protein [Streptomyces sp. H27-D2]|uniref:hypothetical protein n=1 Tax=Streptomyces sp. H27-D2 TaxID=3046304 RepID=UPI002DB71ED3|nr:hypothetical protein [Streptomyces sp. H27-D2]MEC4016975.1 hypothetical protein [Streptomyces sp. H27-D2]